ncbi:MAG: hypothetical protein PVF05_09980 [Gemmatimonadales bacterium]
MTTGTIWRLRWRLALRRRRLLVWNLAVPLVLLVPVVASRAAGSHRAVVVAVFAAFFGAYGSCIPLIRDGMSGWTEKVRLTGYGGRRWLAERTAASTAIDFAELLPVNLVLLAIVHAPLRTVGPVLAATALALAFANLLGVLVAAGVRALGEAALACAVVSLFALHAAGVFRFPAPDSTWATVERFSPFRWVHEVWLGVIQPAAGGLPRADLGYVGPLLLTLAVLALLMLAGGDALSRRIGSSSD